MGAEALGVALACRDETTGIARRHGASRRYAVQPDCAPPLWGGGSVGRRFVVMSPGVSVCGDAAGTRHYERGRDVRFCLAEGISRVRRHSHLAWWPLSDAPRDAP